MPANPRQNGQDIEDRHAYRLSRPTCILCLHVLIYTYQSKKGSLSSETIGGSSSDSGMSSKFERSVSSVMSGVYGAGTSNFSSALKSNDRNHLCFRTSLGPSFIFPNRLLMSAVFNFLASAL